MIKDRWEVLATALKSHRQSFCRAIESPRESQFRLLKEILHLNSSCKFGRNHSFLSIKTYQDFAKNVPFVQYQDIETIITNQKPDRFDLSSEQIEFLELTSGSKQAVKYIPFSKEKLTCFQNAIHPWLYDLQDTYPAIKQGLMYWSVSPRIDFEKFNKFTIPSGAPSDLVYIGEEFIDQIQSLLLNIPSADNSSDLGSWKFLTALELLLAPELSFVSIWSPTFLLELLTYIRNNHKDLLNSIVKRAPLRAEEIAPSLSTTACDTSLIWPKLSLISCWADGTAKRFLPALQQAFPQVQIQGKGLLATEGVITIPWSEAGGCIPAVNSTFLEFCDDSGEIKLIDQLSINNTYSVIITTHGGLYRYELGDLVKVMDYYGKVPVLEFIGRGETVSDFCGEKLAEPFIISVLSNFGGFAILAPRNDGVSGYQLILDSIECSFELAQQLCSCTEMNLLKNPHYQYARTLGQLAPLIVRTVPSLQRRYYQLMLEAGAKHTVIKYPALVTNLRLLSELIV